ncbi:LppU/SCO3897 family protein [Nocardia sp. FBN12]|uniref:LppU/SCO3897 family protein n=1 Tax=Nocardia sp. FBN12 TaxID=3419766 RepID=UPI003D024608
MYRKTQFQRSYGALALALVVVSGCGSNSDDKEPALGATKVGDCFREMPGRNQIPMRPTRVDCADSAANSTVTSILAGSRGTECPAMGGIATGGKFSYYFEVDGKTFCLVPR